MTEPENQPEPAKGGSGSGGKLVPGGMGMLFFGFGLAAGILGAYTATGFLEDSAGLILSVFLSALMVVLILGVLIGSLVTWFAQGRYRKQARSEASDARKWREEADKQRQRVEEATTRALLTASK